MPRLLQASGAGPGVIVWRTEHEGQQAVVAFNTADNERLLDNLELGVPHGRLQTLFDIHGATDLIEPVADASGRIPLALTLPARSGRVWRVLPGLASVTASVTASQQAAEAPTLDEPPAGPLMADFKVGGQASPGAPLRVVVDGDLARAVPVQADAGGRFSAPIDTRRMTNPSLPHRVVAVDTRDGLSSPARTFRVELPSRLLADVEDAAGDDRGLDGRLVYPSHESFVPGQMDLRRVQISAAGGSLQVQLEMGALSTVWGPPNGFDHVAFTIFVELPGRDDGATVMPGQNANLPDGMRWHLRVRAHGWSNALFGPQGADSTHEGTPVTPAAAISADRERRLVRFKIPSEALGDPRSLSGARVFVTTWDYDGGYRALAPEPGAFVLGGGPSDGAKILDASRVIRLP
jgi:hypothetical protein